MTDLQARIEARRQAYGEEGLAALSIFAGGFINFGFWRDVPFGDEITLEQRITSQEAMYELVLEQVKPGDRVLEVGCGRGLGTRIALRHDPASVRGIDLVPEQVERARANNDDERVEFRQGSAYDIPFGEHEFDQIVSVEAAQHFEDIRGFADESFRVLRPGGRLALATFFTGEGVEAQLAELLEGFKNGLDLAHPHDDVLADLRAAGFANVTSTSIGEHVWHGFDQWIAQTEFADSWGRNWIPATERGLVDYYLITANRPE